MVLSIGKLTAQNAEYCQRTVAQGGDDYYAGKGEAVGEWQGEGAEVARALGRGERRRVPQGLIERQHPASGEELGTPATARGSSPTTSPSRRRSRSASSMRSPTSEPRARFATPTTRPCAPRWHTSSARRASCAAARAAPACREPPRAEGFVSAAYRHRMSRAEDPQLHTHVVTANLARAKGSWSALDGYALYKHAKAAGYLYEAHLRHAVRERCPGSASRRSRRGSPRSRACPRRCCGSSAAAAPRSRSGSSARVEAGGGRPRRRRSRPASRRRTTIDTPSWREAVRARAAEHGLGRDELAALTAEAGAGAPRPDADALGSRLVGPRGTDREAQHVREARRLIEWAAAHRDGATVERIEAARGALSAPQRARAAPPRRRARVHDRRAPRVRAGDRRRRPPRAAAKAPQHSSPRASSAASASAAASLSDQQRAALLGLTTSGHGIEAVEALAGTGKTYLAGALRDALRAAPATRSSASRRPGAGRASSASRPASPAPRPWRDF